MPLVRCFSGWTRFLPLAAVAGAAAAQPAMPDYSQQPYASGLPGGTPEIVARCVHQVRMAGVRWDAYNAALNDRIVVARSLPTLSDADRAMVTRKINLAIASESPDKAEMQRALDLVLNPATRNPDSYGRSLLNGYVEEMRAQVEEARRQWRARMAECVATAASAARTPSTLNVFLSGPAAPGDGSWTGTYVSRSYPTTFHFTGGGTALSATFDGRFSDTHNSGSIGNCRRAADGGFDCDYSYRHEDSQKAGQVSGRVHYTHNGRCTIEESGSVVTAVDLKSLDGTPATSPSLYVGARFGGNTLDRQGCS